MKTQHSRRMQSFIHRDDDKFFVFLFILLFCSDILSRRTLCVCVITYPESISDLIWILRKPAGLFLTKLSAQTIHFYRTWTNILSLTFRVWIFIILGNHFCTTLWCNRETLQETLCMTKWIFHLRLIKFFFVHFCVWGAQKFFVYTISN